MTRKVVTVVAVVFLVAVIGGAAYVATTGPEIDPKLDALRLENVRAAREAQSPRVVGVGSQAASTADSPSDDRSNRAASADVGERRSENRRGFAANRPNSSNANAFGNVGARPGDGSARNESESKGDWKTSDEKREWTAREIEMKKADAAGSLGKDDGKEIDWDAMTEEEQIALKASYAAKEDDSKRGADDDK